MQHIYQVLSEVDPIKFIENTGSFKEYNEVVNEMHTQYSKDDDYYDVYRQLFIQLLSNYAIHSKK